MIFVFVVVVVVVQQDGSRQNFMKQLLTQQPSETDVSNCRMFYTRVAKQNWLLALGYEIYKFRETSQRLESFSTLFFSKVTNQDILRS